MVVTILDTKHKNVGLNVSDGLNIQVVSITPELARKYLSNNPKNRKLSKTTVEAYARDMLAGNWDLTGDPIRISADGDLIDGQHRLQACIKSGTSFTSVVISDMEDRVRESIDIGRKRTIGDHLGTKGFTQGVRVAAMARWLVFVKGGMLVTEQIKKASHKEIFAMVEQHPNLNQSAYLTGKSLGVPPSVLAAIHYIGYYLIGKEAEAQDFATAFCRGKIFYPDDAAIVWRERLLRMKEKQTKVSRFLIMRGTAHCWNLFCAKEPTKAINRVPENVKIAGLDLSKL